MADDSKKLANASGSGTLDRVNGESPITTTANSFSSITPDKPLPVYIIDKSDAKNTDTIGAINISGVGSEFQTGIPTTGPVENRTFIMLATHYAYTRSNFDTMLKLMYDQNMMLKEGFKLKGDLLKIKGYSPQGSGFKSTGGGPQQGGYQGPGVLDIAKQTGTSYMMNMIMNMIFGGGGGGGSLLKGGLAVAGGGFLMDKLLKRSGNGSLMDMIQNAINPKESGGKDKPMMDKIKESITLGLKDLIIGAIEGSIKVIGEVDKDPKMKKIKEDITQKMTDVVSGFIVDLAKGVASKPFNFVKNKASGVVNAVTSDIKDTVSSVKNFFTGDKVEETKKYSGGSDTNKSTTAKMVPGYAKGGTTKRDETALVGERGPELVKLPKGSTVFPADRTKDLLQKSYANGTEDSTASSGMTSDGVDKYVESTDITKAIAFNTGSSAALLKMITEIMIKTYNNTPPSMGGTGEKLNHFMVGSLMQSTESYYYKSKMLMDRTFYQDAGKSGKLQFKSLSSGKVSSGESSSPSGSSGSGGTGGGSGSSAKSPSEFDKISNPTGSISAMGGIPSLEPASNSGEYNGPMAPKEDKKTKPSSSPQSASDPNSGKKLDIEKTQKTAPGTSKEFLEKVSDVAKRLGMDPAKLMAIMDFESGLKPDTVNKASGATGLIQFMPSTAKGLGTTTSDLAKMSDVDQLEYVYQYLLPYKGKMNDPADAYMAVLDPIMVGSSLDSPMINGKKNPWEKGTVEYNQNAGLDLDKDGTILKSEAAAQVIKRYEKYKNSLSSDSIQKLANGGTVLKGDPLFDSNDLNQQSNSLKDDPAFSNKSMNPLDTGNRKFSNLFGDADIKESDPEVLKMIQESVQNEKNINKPQPVNKNKDGSVDTHVYGMNFTKDRNGKIINTSSDDGGSMMRTNKDGSVDTHVYGMNFTKDRNGKMVKAESESKTPGDDTITSELLKAKMDISDKGKLQIDPNTLVISKYEGSEPDPGMIKRSEWMKNHYKVDDSKVQKQPEMQGGGFLQDSIAKNDAAIRKNREHQLPLYGQMGYDIPQGGLSPDYTGPKNDAPVIVGEKGNEGLKYPNGDMGFTGVGPKLMNLPVGTQVVSNKNLNSPSSPFMNKLSNFSQNVGTGINSGMNTALGYAGKGVLGLSNGIDNVFGSHKNDDLNENGVHTEHWEKPTIGSRIGGFFSNMREGANNLTNNMFGMGLNDMVKKGIGAGATLGYNKLLGGVNPQIPFPGNVIDARGMFGQGTGGNIHNIAKMFGLGAFENGGTVIRNNSPMGTNPAAALDAHSNEIVNDSITPYKAAATNADMINNNSNVNADSGSSSPTIINSSNSPSTNNSSSTDNSTSNSSASNNSGNPLGNDSLDKEIIQLLVGNI